MKSDTPHLSLCPPLAFVRYILRLAAGLLSVTAAQAEVTPQAGGATVVNVVNGVPVVEIAAPTPAGVSHNVYQNFNVDTAGVVINNSLADGVSAATAAGGISANAQFNGSSARVILNEVTSTQRSSLQGVTEIFGDDASFILANPNGITCNGCGFIRTPTIAGDNGNLREVILSTSDTLSLESAQGALNSLTIGINSAADIIIGPGGLDVSGVDITTLFSRRLLVDGIIEAGTGRLQTLLGTGTLHFDAVQPQQRTLDSTQSDDGTLSVAIDASVAGAMHAGQIYIMATEEGVGVTLDNDLIASAGDVVLTANGDIVYRNAEASGSVSVSLHDVGSPVEPRLSVRGATKADDDVNWNLAANANLTTTGAAVIEAGNEVNIRCAGTSCDVISQQQLTISAHRLNSDADVLTTAGHDLSIHGGVESRGNIHSGNALDIDAGAGRINATNLDAQSAITLAAGNISVNHITAADALQISVSDGVSAANLQAADIGLNSGGGAILGDIAGVSVHISSNGLDAGNITADSLIMLQSGAGVLTGNLTAAGIQVSATDIRSDAVTSTAGITLDARSGDIITDSIHSAADIDIITQSGASLRSQFITAGEQLQWHLSGQSVLSGGLTAGSSIRLLCNVGDCGIRADSDLDFFARSLITEAVLHTVNGEDLTINANLAASADLRSSGALTIRAVDGDIHSTASLQAVQQIHLESAAGGDVSIEGGIRSGGDFIVDGEGNYTHNSQVAQSVGGDWVIDIFSLTNNDIMVAGTLRDGVFRVDRFINHGLLHSDGALDVLVDDWLQNHGVISSLEGVIRLGGSTPGAPTRLIDNHGIIAAFNLSPQQQPEDMLIIDLQALVDDHLAAILRGEQRTATDLQNAIIEASQQALSQLSAGGEVQGALQIDAERLNNGPDAHIRATQLVLNVDDLNNNGGMLLATDNIAITGSSLSNQKSEHAFGVISSRDNIDILLDGWFVNEGIVEAADVTIDAPVHDNLASELVLDQLDRLTIDSSALIETVAVQAWFELAQGGGLYHQYSMAGDIDNPLLQPDPARLTTAFLQAADLSVDALPGGIPLVGDDIFIAELVAAAVRDDGVLPFVVDSRSSIQQLSHLYDNSLNFMASTGLGFAQMPDAHQRLQISEPIVVFQPQSLANGDKVYAPVVLLPGQTADELRRDADLISSRILAYNELLLRAETLNNSGQLLSRSSLVIETLDLKLADTERNWFVDENGDVHYLSASIGAPSVTVNVSGDYVQRGGQLVAGNSLLLEAENIDIDEASVITVSQTGQPLTHSAEAIISSDEPGALIAREHAVLANLEATGEMLVQAGQQMQVSGDIVATDLSLLADTITLQQNAKGQAARLRIGQSLLLQAESDVELDYADILVGQHSAEKGGTTDAEGDFVIMAAAGDIINRASRVVAMNAGFMQAGGDIINRSVQTVVDNATQVSRVSQTESELQRTYDEDGYRDTVAIETTTTTTVTQHSQRVETDRAVIRTGDGGLLQQAGGNIDNVGDIISTGDVRQQAEGRISNSLHASSYIRSQTATETSVEIRTGQAGNGSTITRQQTVTDTSYAAETGVIQAGGVLIQDAGSDIVNNAGLMQGSGGLYQSASGDIRNNSAYVQGEIHAVSQSGGEMVIDAAGDYENTGKLQAGNSISISAQNIDNARLTRQLDDVQSSEVVSSSFWQTTQDVTVTEGRQQLLDTGSIIAGDNIILNASGKITDTAGRYRAGGNGAMTDAEGKPLLDAQGKPVRGGIYASADEGIELKDITWSERDTTRRTITHRRYDDDSEQFKHFTTSSDIGSARRDYTATSELSAAGINSLESARGDLQLSGAALSGDQITLKGRNITLEAVERVRENKSHIGRTIDNSKQVDFDVVKLDADNGIRITTTGDKSQQQGNLLTQGAILDAGSDADDHVMLSVTGNTELLGVNTEDSSYYEHTRKGRMGRRKTTIRETRDIDLLGTRITAGGQLLVNVSSDENGKLIGTSSGAVMLEGADINTGGHAIIYGEERVDALSGLEYEYSRSEVHKRGFAGLTRSGRRSETEEALLGHTEFNTGGDTLLLSRGDINVVAGKIDADSITADAGFGLSEAERAAARADGRASVNIVGDEQVLSTIENKYRRNIQLSVQDNFLSVAEQTRDHEWETTTEYVGSALNARENILLRAASDINVAGSQLGAQQSIRLEAGNDVNITAGVGEYDGASQSYRERVGIEVRNNSNGSNAFAGREQTTSTTVESISRIQPGLIQAGNNVSIEAGGDITQLGSDVVAGNDVYYEAAGSIELGAAVSQELIENSQLTRRDGISASMAFNYDQTRAAVQNAGEGDNAVSKLSSTLQAVDSVSSFVSGPSSTLFAGTTTERASDASLSTVARGASIQAGGSVRMNAGEDISVTGSAVIAELDVELDADNIRILAAEEVFDSSAKTAFDRDGFEVSGQKNSASAGVTTSFDRQRSSASSTATRASLISSGRNTRISANTDIEVTGSDLTSAQDITLDAGRDILLTSHTSSQSSRLDANRASAGAGVAITAGGDGAAIGIYGSGSVGSDDLERVSVTQRNSQVDAGGRLTIKSGGNTTLRGANASAENVSLEVEGDFTLASVQDTGSVSGKKQDASLRVVGGAGAAVSGSVGYGKTAGSSAWVGQQTSLIARERLEGSVKGHTQVDGAVLASETNDMAFVTNTFAYSDIQDSESETSYYANTGISVRADGNGSQAMQQQNNRQTGMPVNAGQQGSMGFTVSADDTQIDRRQINRATVGGGSFTVLADRKSGENSLAGINRDLQQAQQITRDDSSETRLYVSDSALDAAANPIDTANAWLGDLGNYGINTLQMYRTVEQLGDKQGSNAFESLMLGAAQGVIDATDTLGTVTAGLAPSVANFGGMAAQKMVLAVGDMEFNLVKAILELDKNGKLILKEHEILKRNVEQLLAGQSVSINGILSTLEEAIASGAAQTGKDTFVNAFNPSHGLLPDLLEAGWDMLLGGIVMSGNARDLRGLFKESIKVDSSFNIAAHSQGGLLTLRAIDGLDFTHGGQIAETGTVLFSGAPVDAQKFYRTAADAGFKIDSSEGNVNAFFQIKRDIETLTLFGQPRVDPVADLIGFNYDEGDNSSFWGSVFSLKHTFSLHSNYSCLQTTCKAATGSANRNVLHDFRLQDDYIAPTVIAPSEETMQYIKEHKKP